MLGWSGIGNTRRHALSYHDKQADSRPNYTTR
jgi:hypothetical protein